MVAILFRHVAFEKEPWRVFALRDMPNQLGRNVSLRRCISITATMPSACLVAGVTLTRQIPAPVIVHYAPFTEPAGRLIGRTWRRHWYHWHIRHHWNRRRHSRNISSAGTSARTRKPTSVIRELTSLRQLACIGLIRHTPCAWAPWMIAVLLTHIALDEEPWGLLALGNMANQSWRDAFGRGLREAVVAALALCIACIVTAVTSVRENPAPAVLDNS